MSKKNNLSPFTFIAIGLIVLFAIGLAYLSGRSSSVPLSTGSTSAGQLIVDQNYYDFGTVSMANGKVNKTYTLTNSTDQPIVIKRIYTSCMCTTATLIHGTMRRGPVGMQGMGYIPTFSEVIKPGESFEVQATFDPAAHGPAGVGNISRMVTVESPDGGVFELNFKALVTP